MTPPTGSKNCPAKIEKSFPLSYRTFPHKRYKCVGGVMTPPYSFLKVIHKGCGMWRTLLWKNREQKFLPQCLLKTYPSPHFACGEKSVEALDKKGLIHIILYYGCYYYLNLFTDRYL